jgi:hypothetical protein
MTTCLTLSWGAQVEDALAACGHGRTQAHNGLWTIKPQAGLVVAARLEEEWLLTDALVEGPLQALTNGHGLAPETLLAWNASLPGNAKFALDATRHLRLAAEIPLLEDARLSQQMAEVLAGYTAGWRKARQRGGESELDTGGQAPAAATPPGNDALKELCVTAGWAHAERADGRLMVELESRRGFYQAALSARGNGVIAQASLGTGGSVAGEDTRAPAGAAAALKPVCRRALAILLLLTCGRLRYARAAYPPNASAAVLQVVYGHPPCAAEIGRALESLSVGVGLCGEEVKRMDDENLAREYLALGQWAPIET